MPGTQAIMLLFPKVIMSKTVKYIFKKSCRNECLNVTIVHSAESPIPSVVNSVAEIGVEWLDKVLKAREGGQDVVHVAQMFQVGCRIK